ncbi:MAG: UDP-N-acetylglucosamine 1-carboxyvinyltransferase, partial [Clostridia bacterium]|nr:UDP-N-acetylglucosamine 1-carboxyvinyltransferase [Clostridia bacterium]
MAVSCVAKGTGVIVENVFESRFGHVSDLNRMGACIRVSDRVAVVQGVEKLHGNRVCARDLRGGAALVLAGLAAEGDTLVENVHLIDRGYAALEKSLSSLGARVERISI